MSPHKQSLTTDLEIRSKSGIAGVLTARVPRVVLLKIRLGVVLRAALAAIRNHIRVARAALRGVEAIGIFRRAEAR